MSRPNFIGRVRSAQVAADGTRAFPRQRLNVRVEVPMAGGGVQPIHLWLRGKHIDGHIEAGDTVRVTSGQWRRGALRVRKLTNTMTGAQVRAKR